MNNENTIILSRGSNRLTNSYFKHFEKGDTINGCASLPEELKRWDIGQKQEALEELAKYQCTYGRYNEHSISVEEYALEFCICDEDGDFVEGSDYIFAETVEPGRYVVRDSEAGNAIAEYEAKDKVDGIFEADFYEIYDDLLEKII